MKNLGTETIVVEGRRVFNEIGSTKGADRAIERYVVAGWSTRAAPSTTYSITTTTDRLPDDLPRIYAALHRALNLSESDVDGLLRGTTAVLIDLDGSSFYLLVEFLKALGLFCSVGTAGISDE